MNVKANFVQQVEKLMAAQDWLNCQYSSPDWKMKNHPFLDYVWIEVGELAEHEGQVFHYKKKAPDWEQVKLELVDILHFGLSHLIQTGKNPESIAHVFISATEGYKTDKPVIAYCREVANSAINGSFDVYMFTRLVYQCGFTLQDIFDHYLNKYTLNRFRIDNGQVRGEYKKIWSDGREDNEHLVELAADAINHDHLYELLGARYAA